MIYVDTALFVKSFIFEHDSESTVEILEEIGEPFPSSFASFLQGKSETILLRQTWKLKGNSRVSNDRSRSPDAVGDPVLPWKRISVR
jgi:hypothetical protein